VHRVKISLLTPKLPLLLLATVAAWYLTGKDGEAPIATVRGTFECSANIDAMAMASDSSVLAISDGGGTLQVWSPDIGRRQVFLDSKQGHVRCVALEPGGAILATGDLDANVAVWDVASGEVQWSAPAGSGVLRTVALSQDGMTLAAGSSDRCIYLWDRVTHRLKARLSGHINTVTTIHFSPDSQTLVSGSQDGTIRCWDAITGQARWVAPARSDIVAPTVLCLCFSPDGKRIAAAINHDPALRLWDAMTGQELSGMGGLSELIVSVDFSPDGITLATGDSGGSLTLWDLESCRARTAWRAHDGWIRSVAFSSDGRTLASAGEGSVKLWETIGEGNSRPLSGISGLKN
jgi:WD40 repeat protein